MTVKAGVDWFVKYPLHLYPERSIFFYKLLSHGTVFAIVGLEFIIWRSGDETALKSSFIHVF